MVFKVPQLREKKELDPWLTGKPQGVAHAQSHRLSLADIEPPVADDGRARRLDGSHGSGRVEPSQMRRDPRELQSLS